MTVYEYGEQRVRRDAGAVRSTSPYALTGAVFATDRAAVERRGRRASERSRQLLHQRQADWSGGRSAAVRGARASGTNDKAGSLLEPDALDAPRTIKETFVPPTDYRYPFMEAE